MARTTWNKCFNWARRYPVLASKTDAITYLTIERLLMLAELEELRTGRRAKARLKRHLAAMREAKRIRAGAWREEWAYE